MAGFNGMSAYGVEKMLPPEYVEKLHTAEVVAQEAGKHAVLIAENVKDVGTRFTNAARTQLHQKPARTLVAAVGLGFLLGVLWKS